MEDRTTFARRTEPDFAETVGLAYLWAALELYPAFGFSEMIRPIEGYTDYTYRYLPENGLCPCAPITSDAIPAIFAACMARSSFCSF